MKWLSPYRTYSVARKINLVDFVELEHWQVLIHLLEILEKVDSRLPRIFTKRVLSHC